MTHIWILSRFCKETFSYQFTSWLFEKNVTSVALERLLYIWGLWPRFRPWMTHFQIWPIHFIETHIHTNFCNDWLIYLTSAGLQSFSIFGLCDLVLDPGWPVFKFDLNFIKTHIHTNIKGDCLKNVTSIAMTRFFYIWALWPRFWPWMTHFWNWSRFYKDTISTPISVIIDWKMWPLLQWQGFSLFGLCDLVFNPG